jgi:carnitine O-acetyltransferase
VHSDDTKHQWQKHDLRAALKACVADVSVYLPSLAILRFRLVCWLFKQSTKLPQGALAKQIAKGHCTVRAEGIARLYLGGRKSVVFHNHFPIAMHVPPNIESDCVSVAAAMIGSLCALVRETSEFSTALSMFRIPARACDVLERTRNTQSFTILRKGHIYSVSMAIADDLVSLQQVLQEIIDTPVPAGLPNAITIGEYSALPRPAWLKAHRSITKPSSTSNGTSAALQAAREGTFLLCIDHETSPESLTDIGCALRYQNLHNRFFDRGLQFVVFGNGECGFLCDHAVIDGVPAMQLASRLQTNMLSSIGFSNSQQTTLIKASETPKWSALEYTLSPTIGASKIALLREQCIKVFCKTIALQQFDITYFKAKTHRADTYIQLAIQLCFFRCLGFIPSVFEPISLCHLPGGRLDFISPVSMASKKLIEAIIDEAPITTRRHLLQQAAQHHRQEIRIAKQGLGHIGHLLALTVLEVPNNQRIGSTWLRFKESFFSKIDAGSRLLAKRDIVASNGGYNAAVKLFGTMAHKENVFGIGYSIGPQGLTVDIQANGKYAQHGSAFATEFAAALTTVLSI